MKSLLEVYRLNNSDDLITESFKSKYIRMLAQDASLIMPLQRFFNTIGINNVAWDQITDDDITILKTKTAEENTDLLKMYRAYKAGKSDYWSTVEKRRIDFKSKSLIMVGYYNNKLIGVFTGRYLAYRCSNGSLDSIEKPREQESALQACDTVYIILTEKYSTNQLKSDRSQGRSDMVPSLDNKDRQIKHNVPGVLGKSEGGVDKGAWNLGEFTGYCRFLANDAKRRWKEIIAKNKFKQTADTKQIDELVEKTMKSYFEFMQDAMKLAATKSINEYSLSELTRLVVGTAKSNRFSAYGWTEGGLLNVYNNYCSSNINLQKSTRSRWDSAATVLTSRNKEEQIIKTIVEQINKKMVDLKEQWSKMN